MLISFSVENFKSIRERVRLDLVPSSSIKDEGLNLVSTGNEDFPYLHRVVSIYGLNGSGKSTLLRAAQVMRMLILTSAKESTHGDKLPVEPFRLDVESSSKPTTFGAEFLIDQIRYYYEFSATQERVTHELLYAYPNGSKQIWFERTYSHVGQYEWKYSPYFRGDKVSITSKTLQNTLYLSKAVQNNDQQLIAISEYFRRKFFVTFTSSDAQSTYDHFDTEEGREKILRFLRGADLGFEDIIVKKNEVQNETDFFPKGSKYFHYDTMAVHRIPGSDQTVSFNLEKSESTGTIKMFKMAGLIINSLNTGKTLLMDELEHGLHVQLQYYLIELFSRPSLNPKGAQLIFTTHAPLILAQNQLRRDQIWFASKTPSKNTILYSLIDVAKHVKDGKPVRKG